MGSEWDAFIEGAITSLNLYQYLPKRFTDELNVIQRLSNFTSRAELQDWLCQLPNILPAGEASSNELRTKGNAMFKHKSSNHLVLAAYNKAILAAPAGSRALALSHANRAVVLIRLGRYREAYEDCQLALDGDYPAEKRLKVYFRQAECAESMNDHSKLGPIVDGISQIADGDLSQVLSKGERVKLQTLQTKYDAVEKRSVEAATRSDDSNFLAYVKICSNREGGRHAIAQDTLLTDHIVARETAVSFVPVYDPNVRNTYDCQKCAKVNVIPFPCSTCGSACYCSIQCRDDHRPVHRFECTGYQKRLWHFIGIAHLGMRSFLDGFDTIRSKMLKLCDEKCDPKFDVWLTDVTSGGEKQFGHYKQVLGLVTNFHRMDPDDVLRYALAGLMLSIYLFEFTPFLSAYGLTQGIDRLRHCCAALIMRHIGQLVCNGHAISELRAKSSCASSYGGHREAFVLLQEDNFLPQAGLLHLCFSSSRIFTAIFPQISMFNHDCNPNIRNHFDRSTLTVYATRKIPQDSEVVNCYGPHYKLMPRDMRLMHLKQQYCFDCYCDRCRGGDDMFLSKYNVICCSVCWQQFSMELNMEHLLAGNSVFCTHCSAAIDTDWVRIFEQMDDDQEYVDRDFQRIVTLYDRCEQTLVGFNQTKADVLDAILHTYTKHATMNHFLHSALQKYAMELVSSRRERYDRMSLEFLTACSYLLDLWAMLYLVNGHVPVELSKEEHTALKDFRAAISIVGMENRILILDYAEQFVILNEETRD
ncbi:SET and MYND domain-containing protein 4-like [Anopheles maculipalpis]|uniref:SET and MYND domain-containing protein 4-like n=1 Tax=Anopheles maculipalpis TaxID=1496333 RepID=UPI0021596944|nr:SET and MYND domain-containing protein 4-like [Anopheles maculipalpis]